jgi:hypothetical protein
VPDERFGETICAVVEPATPVALDRPSPSSRARQRLAAYKAPRHVGSRPTRRRSQRGGGRLDRPARGRTARSTTSGSSAGLVDHVRTVVVDGVVARHGASQTLAVARLLDRVRTASS